MQRALLSEGASVLGSSWAAFPWQRPAPREAHLMAECLPPSMLSQHVPNLPKGWQSFPSLLPLYVPPQMEEADVLSPMVALSDGSTTAAVADEEKKAEGGEAEEEAGGRRSLPRRNCRDRSVVPYDPSESSQPSKRTKESSSDVIES